MYITSGFFLYIDYIHFYTSYIQNAIAYIQHHISVYTILYRKNSLYNIHYIAISGCININIAYIVLAKKPIIQGTNSSIYEIYRKSNT